MWELIVSAPDHCLSFYFEFCLSVPLFVFNFINDDCFEHFLKICLTENNLIVCLVSFFNYY